MTTATGTIVDESERTFLVLRALVSHDGPRIAETGQIAWCAEVCDAASPLAGLYAYGDSLSAAREALAVAAWAAIDNGELTPFGVALTDVAGVRVVAATSATYEAEWLAVAVANDVT